MTDSRPDAARDVVERYERDIALPADVQERIAARLAASLATDVAPAPVAPKAEGWRSPRVVWMGVAAAAAALLLLWAGLRATTGHRDIDPNGMSAPHQRTPEDRVRQAVPRTAEAHATASAPRSKRAVAPVETPTEPMPEVPPNPEPSEAADASPASAPKPPTPASRSRRAREELEEPEPPEPPEPPAPEASSLQPELVSLEAVRLSLRTDPPATTLAKATAHRKAFPHGLLGREARALEIIARCRAGQHKRGQTAARAFAEAFPASTLIPRIDAACDMEATK